MKRKMFSAQELYVLADTADKSRMYGIPNGFKWLSDEEAPVVRQEISDKLLEEGILTMDFDGKLFVSPDYTTLVSIYSDCSKCMTVNRQKTDGRSEDLIFWKFNGKFYCAEVVDEDYLFSETDVASIEVKLTEENWSDSSVFCGNIIVIPQNTLTKAKRRIMQDETEEALRILKQNGADERSAVVLCDGLQEKGRYLRLLLMDMSSENFKKTEKVWLNSRGILYALGTTVINYRTCTVFNETDRESIRAEEKELIASFLLGEWGTDGWKK